MDKQVTLLQKISLVLSDKYLFESLSNLFSSLGNLEANVYTFEQTDPNYLPQIEVKKGDYPSMLFSFSDNSTNMIQIRNITNVERISTHDYSALSFDEYIKRVEKNKIVSIDHIGFNLPWFTGGYHPDLEKFRNRAKTACAYHFFPLGEPWDFIIPATKEEIAGETNLDYSKVRKPKFELVTFDKCSIPLIQFDLSISVAYEDFSALFPEAIHVPELRNIWVYIKNSMGIDVCLVLNENKGGDWSQFFSNSRLK